VDLVAAVAVFFGVTAVMVPSFSQNRRATSESVCKGNVGAIARASAEYANDHEGMLPHPNWTFNRRYAGWLCRPPFSLPNTNIETGLLWPYLKSYAVYRCPSEDTNAPAFAARKQKYTSYVMNGAACFFEDQWRPNTAPVAKLKPEAILFWQPDERNFRDYNDGASRPDEGSTRLHSGETPVGNVDGSVGTMSVQQFNAEALRRPGRLWWSLKSKDGAG
jgi:hypothetical protein